jgi:hypothetical protein
MKNPADWKEEDLQNLIDTGAEEGPQQEFKSAAALKVTDREKTEISKMCRLLPTLLAELSYTEWTKNRPLHIKPPHSVQSIRRSFIRNG